VSLTFSQRFRNLAEQYKAVLERWWVFWELVTLDSPDRYRKAIDAWEGVKQAFLTAANTLAELRRDVPPEVANLWIGPTERVFVGYGSLRVGAALDTQAKWFQKWIREVIGQRDVGWIWERGFYAELGRLEQAIEDLMTAVEVIQEWEGKRQAEAIARLLEQPESAVKDGAAAPVEATPATPASSGNDARSSFSVTDVYVPATAVFRLQDKYKTYKQFKRWLDSIPPDVIRRKKPSRNRLLIHAADFVKYWRRMFDATFEGLDEVAERMETMRDEKRNKAHKQKGVKAEQLNTLFVPGHGR